jgi:hypothetical protein
MIVDVQIVEEIRRESRRRHGSRGEHKVYIPWIVYEYQVDGQLYRSQPAGGADYESITPAGGLFNEIRQAKRGDNKIQVYVNPQNPADTRLDDHSSPYPYLILVTTSVLSLAGLVLLIAVLSGKVRSLDEVFEQRQ